MVDECGICNGDGSSCQENIVPVFYNSEVDLGGFQFKVNGATLISASGGVAADAGFSTSTSSESGVVLGFSFSGAVIPAGEGILTNLLVQGSNNICLSNEVLSDVDGISSLDSEVSDCLTLTYIPTALPGCTDLTACNYNSNATEDDGSCTYAEENFDCDGNCLVDIDCLGVCNGDSLVDECGICGGTGPQENFDCDGNCLFAVDECGICNGDGSSCQENIVPVFYNSEVDLGGFQFKVNGATLISASGGVAADAGFSTSTSSESGVVLGFSFSGAVIPAGEGILTNLLVQGSNNICLSNEVLSDVDGISSLDSEVSDCLTLTYIPTALPGCTDLTACNYNSNATEDDGSCTYAEENFDCDGNCLFAVDECGICNGDGSSCQEITVDIFYNSSIDIGGFQFNVDGVTLVSASGGAAEENGFTVSSSSSVALGFSLTGSSIPAGNGLLTTLTIIGTNICLSADVVSGPGGFTVNSEISNCLTLVVEGGYQGELGCTDSNACNYNQDATVDDGSCTYAEENLDCDGNCLFAVDECGICNGDGSSCQEITVDIFYNSSIDIGGFQFNVDGVTLVSASGGAAEENGFTVSSSSSVALGFSLTGSSIPAGNGLLTTLTIIGTNICLSADVVSGPGGFTVNSEISNCLTLVVEGGYQGELGCTDSNACNYNQDATVDDGSCTYAEDNFDCAGNCLS